jgi:hypothetical protein
MTRKEEEGAKTSKLFRERRVPLTSTYEGLDVLVKALKGLAIT